MNIPEQEWKYKEWVEYIIKEKEKVFSSKKENMLKVYYIHADKRSTQKLLEPAKRFGEFYLITLHYEYPSTGSKISAEYWIHEKEPGLLMLFTSSTREGYEKTLKNKLRTAFGLYHMWIKPETFKIVRDDLIENKNCGILNFYGERKRNEYKVISYVKEHANRKLYYRTDNKDDGIKRVKELEYHLGLSVRSIEFVYENSRVQITTEGLFHLKKINQKAFELMDHVIEKIREEENQMRNITQSITTEIVKDKNIENYKSMPGRIQFDEEQDKESTTELIAKLKSHFVFFEPKFVAIDPIHMISDVIDRNKGTIFSIIAFKNSIILMPKYKVTFESFLEFYKEIVENIDESAKLLPLSEVCI
ncbi:MAG: hypothetical protein L0H55_14585 [Candidatus Nitrosocosmicus sp.]|nr:hypothetical protein [Candidatus Nitrosocosmicus sp.]